MKHFFRVFCLFFSIFWLFFAVFSPRILGHADEVPEKNERMDGEAPDSDILRFLVLGIDRTARLTDSIFLVTLNATEQNARILQIPRDT